MKHKLIRHYYNFIIIIIFSYQCDATNRIFLEFGPWSEWSACNGSLCGGLGTQKRIRRCLVANCPDEVQETVCRYEDENCIAVASWTEWSDWSPCSTFCGDGTKIRTRICLLSYSKGGDQTTQSPNSLPYNDPPFSPPIHRSQECLGESYENQSCTLRYNCKVDGEWTEWSKWDICDATPCSKDVGQQMRHRRCTNPRPMYGGRRCHGSPMDTKPCYNNDYCSEAVDGEWCSWMDWTSCKEQVQKRARHCECPKPVNGGKACDGSSDETETCN